MIPVSEVLPEVADALGLCAETDSVAIFRKLTQGIRALAAKGDWDPLLGEVEIPVTSRCFALPRDVETVLAVTLDGYTTSGRDRYFSYHLNGPGHRDPCANRLSWQDAGSHATFFELPEDCALGYCLESSADAGEGVAITAYGSNADGNRIFTAGAEGVTLIPNCVAASTNSPTFSRVTRLRKPLSQGPVEVKAYPAFGYPMTVAILDAQDTEARCRRLTINADADLVRVAYRRRTFEVRTQHDLIPVDSPLAIILMMHALKCYETKNLPMGLAYEAQAARLVAEEDSIRRPPVVHAIQVEDGTLLHDKTDHLD